jgi:hypothetical protein
MLDDANIIESSPGLGPSTPFNYLHPPQLNDVDGLPSSRLLEP